MEIKELKEAIELLETTEIYNSSNNTIFDEIESYYFDAPNKIDVLGILKEAVKELEVFEKAKELNAIGVSDNFDELIYKATKKVEIDKYQDALNSLNSKFYDDNHSSCAINEEIDLLQELINTYVELKGLGI